MHRVIAKLGLKVLDFEDNAIGCLRAWCKTGDQSYIIQPPPEDKPRVDMPAHMCEPQSKPKLPPLETTKPRF